MLNGCMHNYLRLHNYYYVLHMCTIISLSLRLPLSATLEVSLRPGPIAVPLAWLGPRDGFTGNCNSSVRLISARASVAMTQAEFVAKRYYARGCGQCLHSSPKGILRLVGAEGKKTGSNHAANW